MQKCTSRWKLIAPFDTTISEEQWEQYYKERAALDWYTTAPQECSGGDNLPWTEDFPKPKFKYFITDDESDEDNVQYHANSLRKALKETVSGCPKLTAAIPDFADRLASGIYMLHGRREANCNGDSQDFHCQTRLYSPYGLGTSVDFRLSWHCRQRLISFEHWSRVKYATRGVQECRPLKPQKSHTGDVDDCDYDLDLEDLFEMEQLDSGYMKRTLPKMRHLRSLEAELFGRRGVLSDRKLFLLIMYAATSVYDSEVTGDLGHITTPCCHQWKKNEGEAGDTTDEEDKDYQMSSEGDYRREGDEYDSDEEDDGWW